MTDMQDKTESPREQADEALARFAVHVLIQPGAR
jgi:hypothetical protein